MRIIKLFTRLSANKAKDGINSNDLELASANKMLRFLISWMYGIVIVIGACVGGVLGGFLFFWWWLNTSKVPVGTVNISEALNFAGVMITIMAFVSAFYILVIAIDTFKISSDITENRKYIEANSSRLVNFESRLSEDEQRLETLRFEAIKLRADAQLTADIIQEISAIDEDARKNLRRIERLHSALSLICDIVAGEGQGKVNAARAYTVKAGERLSELIDSNDHRRARVVLLSQMVGGDLPSGVRVLDYHVQAVRAEAEGEGPNARRATAVLDKYNAWLNRKNTDQK